MLPWREDIVRGVLGADLIGFHAYDYVRHFGFAGRLSIALVVDSERERVDLGETSVHCQGSARILYACYAPTA